MKKISLVLALTSVACASPPKISGECPAAAREKANAPHQHEHEHEHEHAHAESHDHALRDHGAPASPGDATATATREPSRPLVIPHADLRSFSNNGNTLVGLLTPSLGGGSLEIWESSVAPNGRTPRHTHSSPEIFVLLEGEGEIIVGDEALPFKAPCTVYAPPNVPHEVHNTGTVKTRQIVIIESHSHIVGADGAEMTLPWRKAPRGTR